MDYVELRSFNNYIEASIVLNMLQHRDINCHLKDEHILTVDPLLTPALGGIKLMVYHSQAERAWDMMEQAELDYLKSIPCPVCKSHKLKVVSITRQHKCRLSAIISMLLNGHSMEVKKVYQCEACGYDFKELP
jgi:rubredoxin